MARVSTSPLALLPVVVVGFLCLGLPADAQAAGCFFFVRNAAIAAPPLVSDEALGKDEEFDGKVFRERLIGGHAIKPGTGVVLAFWESAPGPQRVLDAGSFKRFTVSVGELRIGTYVLPRQVTRALLSEGGSAWIHKGAGSHTDNVTGTLEVREFTEKGVSVRVDVEGLARGADPIWNEARRISMRDDFNAREVSQLEATALLEECFEGYSFPR